MAEAVPVRGLDRGLRRHWTAKQNQRPPPRTAPRFASEPPSTTNPVRLHQHLSISTPNSAPGPHARAQPARPATTPRTRAMKRGLIRSAAASTSAWVISSYAGLADRHIGDRRDAEHAHPFVARHDAPPGIVDIPTASAPARCRNRISAIVS